jgi:hypothetical protein
MVKEVTEDPLTNAKMPDPTKLLMVETAPVIVMVGLPAVPLALVIERLDPETAIERFVIVPAFLTIIPLPADSKDPEAPFKVI